jgi:hypothetical protein
MRAVSLLDVESAVSLLAAESESDPSTAKYNQVRNSIICPLVQQFAVLHDLGLEERRNEPKATEKT